MIKDIQPLFLVLIYRTESDEYCVIKCVHFISSSQSILYALFNSMFLYIYILNHGKLDLCDF